MEARIKKYSKGFDYSRFILDQLKIDEFPLDPLDIIAKKKSGAQIFVLTKSEYLTFLRTHGKTEEHMKAISIKDARCYYQPSLNAYLIIYNEDRAYVRIRFSLAHELGHIVLNHLNDERTEIDRGGLDDYIYWAYEGEANTFAGTLLAPPILIQEILAGRGFSIREVARYFELSESSVRDYRLPDYKIWQTWKHTNKEQSILNRCRSKLHPQMCFVCNGIAYGAKFKYCIYCGELYKISRLTISHPDARHITKRRGDQVKYKQYHEANGHLSVCLKCKNEELIIDATFCHICGNPIKNECCAPTSYEPGYDTCREASENGIPLNARYCPYCGEKTSFFKAKILKPWDEEKMESDLSIFPPPDDDSEDLPY